MNVVVVVPGGITETLQATPLLRTLRAGLPSAHLALLCSPAAEEVALGVPALDETVVVAGLQHPAGAAAAVRLWLVLRRRRIDVVLLCGGGLAALLAAFLSGVPRRGGSGSGLSRLLLTDRVMARRRENRAVSWLRLAGAAGVRQQLHSPMYEPGPEARREAERLLHVSGLADGRLLVALAPGSGFAEADGLPGGAGTWESERYAHLANQLALRHGAGIIFLGTPADRPAIERTMLDLGTSAVDLSGQGDTRVVAGILARCDLLVGGDSPLLQLAAAVGTAAVGLFGASDGVVRGPYGTDHRIIQGLAPAGSDRNGDLTPASRINQIRVEDVLASIEASL